MTDSYDAFQICCASFVKKKHSSLDNNKVENDLYLSIKNLKKEGVC
jgi:hypothetical protein